MLRILILRVVSCWLAIIATTVVAETDNDKLSDFVCRQPPYYQRPNFVLDNSRFKNEISKQEFDTELRQGDAELKRGWALAKVGEETKKREIARKSLLELADCLAANLRPEDKVYVFDECRETDGSRKPDGSMASCGSGWIVRRDGVPIITLILFTIDYCQADTKASASMQGQEKFDGRKVEAWLKEQTKTQPSVMFRSHAGIAYRTDSDTEIYFLANNKVTVLDYGFGLMASNGSYEVSATGTVKLCLNGMRNSNPLPPFFMHQWHGETYLAREETSKSDAMLADSGTGSDDMKSFWTFNMFREIT